MILRGKIFLAALYSLTILSGIVTATLYVALIKFPPADVGARSETTGATGSRSEKLIPESGTTIPPEHPSNDISPISSPSSAAPAGTRPTPGIEPWEPGGLPEGALPDDVPPGQRSEAFKEARRAIFEGKAPDFNKFEGPEREALIRIWDQYQARRARRGGAGIRGHE